MSKRKTITKAMAKQLEVEVTRTGFTVWMREGPKVRHWVLDGSDMVNDGIVRLSHSDIWKHRAEFEEEHNHVRITRKPKAK